MVCRGRCVDFGAQVLGNLHGHAAHATGRGMDQHFLATLHASVLGQRLPGRQGRCRGSAAGAGGEVVDRPLRSTMPGAGDIPLMSGTTVPLEPPTMKPRLVALLD